MAIKHIRERLKAGYDCDCIGGEDAESDIAVLLADHDMMAADRVRLREELAAAKMEAEQADPILEAPRPIMPLSPWRQVPRNQSKTIEALQEAATSTEGDDADFYDGELRSFYAAVRDATGLGHHRNDTAMVLQEVRKRLTDDDEAEEEPAPKGYQWVVDGRVQHVAKVCIADGVVVGEVDEVGAGWEWLVYMPDGTRQEGLVATMEAAQAMAAMAHTHRVTADTPSGVLP